MVAREYLEKGRNLAERIPYSVIALASRFAVADRSNQGERIREETFYLFREEYKVPLLPPEVAAFPLPDARLLSDRERNCNFVFDRSAAW